MLSVRHIVFGASAGVTKGVNVNPGIFGHMLCGHMEAVLK